MYLKYIKYENNMNKTIFENKTNNLTINVNKIKNIFLFNKHKPVHL